MIAYAFSICSTCMPQHFIDKNSFQRQAYSQEIGALGKTSFHYLPFQFLFPYIYILFNRKNLTHLIRKLATAYNILTILPNIWNLDALTKNYWNFVRIKDASPIE